jgi:phosphatidylinositol alpha-mannosyltransferase
MLSCAQRESSQADNVMRVALFHSTLPQPGRKVGGVEVFVHRLGNRLAERGHQVTVFTFGARPQDARYRVESAGPGWVGTRAARLTLAPLALNLLTQHPFDVFHLHGDDWFLGRRQIPTVRTLHGSALFEARSATSTKRRLVQSAVYPLEILASRLATLSFDTGSTLPRGYRTDGSLTLAVEARAGPSGSRSSRPTLLFVGTWDGRKRGSFLAEQFAKHVLPRNPDAELIMVSDRCVEAAGVRWVRFPTDDELAVLYRTAWVFCMPSTYEGFGMPYLEAMVHGLPVVATPNPGSRHVLGDGAGYLVNDGALAQALNRLLADPNERAQVADAGRRRAATFSWARVVDEHETAYRLAIDRFQNRRRAG